jgi:hypothetical protein
LTEAGERAAIIVVFEFPPNAFLRMNVSLDSLYGTYMVLFPVVLFYAKTEMHFPRTESDLLMFEPSFSLSPVAPVEAALSEPAKSTRLISLIFSLVGMPFSLSINL